ARQHRTRHRPHRRLRPLRHRGSGGARVAARPYSLGRALGRVAVRAAGRRALRVLASARARPPRAAFGPALPRQHRRAEALGRHRDHLLVRRRLAARGPAARPFRGRGPVHRPHLRAGEVLLRHRLRGPRLRGAPGLPAAGRRAGSGGARPRPADGARRHLPRDGRAAVLHAGGERAVPAVGVQRDRHDQHAGSQARAGSGALLRDRRHGHGLRLLAPGPRPRHGGAGGEGPPGERRPRPRPGPGGGAAARAAPRPLPRRLRPRARPRHHHRPGAARSGAVGQARRCSRARSERLGSGL
ncbi:MAG: 5'-methylthioadenosine phosphorylase, partial [uncultured Acetobacteraceae bacterium]